MKQLNGPSDIALATRLPDEAHVALDVTALALLEELLGQLSPATLHSELHEAAVHHVIGLEACCKNLLVKVASTVVAATIYVDLHQSLEDSQGHHGTSSQVSHNDLGKLQVTALPTKRKQSAAKTFTCKEPIPLNSLEDLPRTGIPGLGEELQQRLVDAVVRGRLLGACHAVETAGQFNVLTLQTIGQEQSQALCGKLDGVAQAIKDASN
mmetsp:Transcript_24102/g.60981  ORF Transcript_24102/g.60981 Transcript_24102/m.60981 type:complete len:210 (-) Transcript_24102:2-631(-)